jgi:hypothetical protein
VALAASCAAAKIQEVARPEVHTAGATASTDSFAAYDGRFCPSPGEQLVWWLLNVVPLEAPVLPLYALDLPLTAPPKGGLVRCMRDLGLEPELIAILMRPPIGPGGIPRYAPNRGISGEVDAFVRDPQRGRGKLRGKPIWQMEAAIHRDIQGWSWAQIADGTDRSYGSPYEGWRSEKTGKVEASGDPRPQRGKTSERWARSGRELLHALGAWPWAHADKGTQPPDWRSREDFLWPLVNWHWLAMKRLESHLEHRQDVLDGRTLPPDLVDDR